MGAHLTMKCPHCTSDSIAMQLIGSARALERSQRHAFLQCPECLKPVCASLYCFSDNDSPLIVERDADGMSISSRGFPGEGSPLRKGWRVEHSWPEPPSLKIPEHLPPSVRKALVSAERAYGQRGDEETAAGAYGRALDLATKIIAEKEPDAERYEGKNLNNRISMMVKARRLTPELGEWANHIKAVRNGAMHEIAEIKRDELSALRVFTEMVLRYLFTLPGMLNERKEATKAGLSDPVLGEQQGNHAS